jgi:phage shock protein E
MKTILLVLLVALLGGCSELAEVGTITPAELASNPPAGVTILDVRTPAEFEKGHVPGAINIPRAQLAARAGELGAGEGGPVVVYCERGGRARKAISVLRDEGFDDLLHLEGDMQAWRAMQVASAKE